VLDAVIVTTESIAEKFARFNSIVIHNYPDLDMLSNPSSIEKERKKKVLVYVGGISRLRGAVEMVRALEHLDHIDSLCLNMIGRFEPPELERELQTLPGYRRICLLGWLKPEEVYKELRFADVGLVCLHPEPYYIVACPTKLFEYMAAGLPLVASNFPLWKDIVEGNNCGICVDPLDPKAIAQAIEYLITHPEEAKKMGENGKKAVLEKYNWEKESKKLLKVYEELVRK
jgi:glycosyltransferase involved in cell wall biosynthesis